MIVDALSLADQPLSVLVERWKMPIDRLRRWAEKGWIPGAYKHASGHWFISPAALITDPEVVESMREASERQWNHRQEGGQVLREGEEVRAGSVRASTDDTRSRRIRLTEPKTGRRKAKKG